jgi:hypothetical protein
MTVPPQPPPPEGRIANVANIIKGLNLQNVLIIALLVVIGIPTYAVWRVLNDEKLMNRFMSEYEEFSNQQSGCVMRHVKQRGGPDQWGVSSGFAFQGADRWFVSVVLQHEPTLEEVASYCESLKLIADRMLDSGNGKPDLPDVGQ